MSGVVWNVSNSDLTSLMPKPPLMVIAEDVRSADDSPQSVIDVDRWQRLATAALRTEHAAGELTLTFVDQTEIAALNAEHMGKTGPTDVLSFPLDDDPMPDIDIPVLLGDIVISPRDRCSPIRRACRHVRRRNRFARRAWNLAHHRS